MPPTDHEIDPPVPLDELRRASTEQLLERHVGVPLRHLTAEVITEVAQRVNAVLSDCERVENGSTADEGTHDPDCWLAHNACWAARIRRTLTGEDTDHHG